MPETRDSLTDIENLPIDTRIGRHRSRSTDVADVRIDADAEQHQAREPVAPDRRRRQRRRDGDLGVGRPRTSRRPSRSIELPARAITRSCSASTPSARPPRSGCCSSRSPPRSAIFLLLQAAFGSTRLAILVLPDPAVRAGRRRPRGLARRPASSPWARSSGFFTVLGIAARNGIMMINHFQHLERDEGDDVRAASSSSAARGSGWRRSS